MSCTIGANIHPLERLKMSEISPEELEAINKLPDEARDQIRALMDQNTLKLEAEQLISRLEYLKTQIEFDGALANRLRNLRNEAVHEVSKTYMNKETKDKHWQTFLDQQKVGASFAASNVREFIKEHVKSDFTGNPMIFFKNQLEDSLKKTKDLKRIKAKVVRDTKYEKVKPKN